MNLKEIQSLAIRERIDINLHSSLFADRPWCLIASRRTGEGEIKITFYGRDIEELLARGVEAVSGITLPRITSTDPVREAPNYNLPATLAYHYDDDIPF